MIQLYRMIYINIMFELLLGVHFNSIIVVKNAKMIYEGCAYNFPLVVGYLESRYYLVMDKMDIFQIYNSLKKITSIYSLIKYSGINLDTMYEYVKNDKIKEKIYNVYKNNIPRNFKIVMLCKFNRKYMYLDREMYRQLIHID